MQIFHWFLVIVYVGDFVFSTPPPKCYYWPKGTADLCSCCPQRGCEDGCCNLRCPNHPDYSPPGNAQQANDKKADDNIEEVQSDSNVLGQSRAIFIIITSSAGLLICCILWIIFACIRRRRRNRKYILELQNDVVNDEDKTIETIGMCEDIDNERTNTEYDEKIPMNQ